MVTGLGAVTPLGVNVRSTWTNILAKKCAIGNIHFNAPYDKLPSTVGAQVDRESEEFKSMQEEVITNARAQEPGFIQFALCAANEAVLDSSIHEEISSGKIDPSRCGVAIGSGIGSSVQEVSDAHDLVKAKGIRRLSPYFVPRLLINLAAGHVSIAHNLRGPNHSAVTACASGAHSIGDAARLIAYGDADVMVAGGTESSMSGLSFAGFSRLKALSTNFNNQPEKASRPFDQHRDGFVMGEGAGVVVLEEFEQAKARGANIYAELQGYGLSGDSFHLTAPAEDGRGAKAAMKAALANSGIQSDQVDYINAHATSTPLGDQIESEAIAHVFGRTENKPAVSSTKGAIGHLLGAAGAVEAIMTILSIHHQVVPPTCNLDTPDVPEGVLDKIDLVTTPNESRQVRAAVSNSFGFGGTNASLLFTKL